MPAMPLSVSSAPRPQLRSGKLLPSESASPPRRRVTRSQSRELGAAGSVRSNSVTTGLGFERDVVGTGRLQRGRKKNRSIGEELGVVIEESPAHSNSPHQRIRLDHPPSHHHQIEPESPEDPVNISGTTFLPTDSEPDTGDLDPVMMAEALPDLQRAATGILDFLIPRAVDPVTIVNAMQRLRDPKNTQSRKLERFMTNLKTESQFFGSQKYIDVNMVDRLLPSISLDESPGQRGKWNPRPILYKANCARLAVEVVLASVGTDTPRQVIKELEGRFPSPFMTGLAAKDGNEGGSVGMSALEKATLELALDIRTQFLKLELEARQHEENFDPEAILRGIFFDERMGDEVDSDDGQVPLRGFGLAPFQDADGRLPQRFEEAVYDRVHDIGVHLRNDEDGSFDLQGLKAAYHWQGFAFRAARWLRKRDDEISRELKQQPNMDDVRDVVERELSRRNSLDRTSRDNDLRDVSVGRAEPTPVQEPVKLNGDQRKGQKSAAEAKERRKSKGPFRNFFAIERVTERLRSATDVPEPRRLSDSNGVVAQRAVRLSPSGPRRQTLPASAFASPRRAQSPPREIPASPEAGRTSQRSSPDLEDDYIPVADSHLNVSETMDREVERSHSPPMSNGTARERRQETAPPHSTHTTNAEAGLPSSKEVWDAVFRQPAAATQPTPGPSKRPVTQAQRRAFIDRQENAYRVSPISQDAGSADRRRERLHPRKRTRALFNYDDDDDNDDFTQDNRTIDIASRRAEKPDQSRHKRRRLDVDLAAEDLSEPRRDVEEEEERPTVTTTQEPVTTRTQLPWERPVPSTAPQPESGWLSSAPQPRYQKRWSDEENDRLIQLIGIFGPQWARIKRQDDVCPASDGGPKLLDRDPVQLKDRARNLLLAFLRNGEPLPKNFDQVTIKAVDRKRLEKQGIKIPIPLRPGSKTGGDAEE